MKIIAKDQDFYEYEAYTYGMPDQSIIWERHKNKVSYDKFDPYTRKNIKKILQSMIYNPYTLNGYSKYFIYMDGYRFNDTFTQALIGIYPYVYLCIDYWGEGSSINSKHITCINVNEFKDPEYLNLLLTDEYNLNPENFPAYLKNAKKKGIKYLYLNESKYKTDDIWIKENRDIFNYLGSPVFMAYFNKDKFHISVDVNIIKDTDFFKHYNREDIDANVYTNIEQFIVERNMKPIPEADNKTKIISAGFDLKTSFRNM